MGAPFYLFEIGLEVGRGCIRSKTFFFEDPVEKKK